jgi:hypothetical protein
METLKAFYLIANFYGAIAAHQPALSGYETLRACMSAGDQASDAWLAWLTRNPAFKALKPRTSILWRMDEYDDRPAASWLIGPYHAEPLVHLLCVSGDALTAAQRMALRTSP